MKYLYDLLYAPNYYTWYHEIQMRKICERSPNVIETYSRGLKEHLIINCPNDVEIVLKMGSDVVDSYDKTKSEFMEGFLIW